MKSNRIWIFIVWMVTVVVALLMVFGLAELCIGQERPFTFDDFSGGINHNGNWSLIQQNQCYYLRNVVIDDPIGALKVRPGVTLVRDSLTLYSQTLSLHSHKLDNGNTFLFHLEQWTDSGFASIYASNSTGRFTGAEPASRHWAEWLYPTPGHWLTWHGKDYFFNGRNRPRVFDLNYPPLNTVRAFAPVHHAAPGQLEADPIAVPGNLNGWYQYAQIVQVPCSAQVAASVPWSKRFGVLSVPVEAYDEKIRVTNYYGLISDSTCTVAAADSFWVLTVRTRGNSNDYDTDSLFKVDSVRLRNDEIANYEFTDTISDASLTASTFWGKIRDTIDIGNVHLVLGVGYKRDTLDHVYAPGSLTFLTRDTGSLPDDTIVGGYCFGVTHLRNLYTMTFRDKITGIETDSCRILVFSAIGQFIRNVTLGVPLPPSSRYDRILYRAHHAVRPPYESGYSGYESQVFYALDTITDDTVTIFVDTAQPCSLEVYNEPYNRRVPITNYAGAITHENVMYAWDAEQVYVSVADTAIFPFFNALEFDLGQGDPIVRLVSFEGFIAVYKRYSTWILYTRDGTVYDARKGNDGLGLVAPYAVASYGATNFVVGQSGLYSEVANPYRDNDLDRDYLDDAFPLYTASETDLLKTNAIIFNDRLMISYPDEDMTRVLYLKTNGWGEWTYAFQAACIYDTAWGKDVQARRVMVFVKPGTTELYLIDDSATTDAGDTLKGYWQKKYLGFESELPMVVSEARLWSSGGFPDSTEIDVDILNERSWALGSTTFNKLQNGYGKRYFLAAANNVGHFLWLRMWIPKVASDIVVHKFELVTNPAGLD